MDHYHLWVIAIVAVFILIINGTRLRHESYMEELKAYQQCIEKYVPQQCWDAW